MQKKITIAIDGFSSTGKSTIAKQLAKALGYIYVDTGAMYRAVTLFAMQNNFIGKEKNNTLALVKLLPKINLKFVYNDTLGFAEMYLNDTNVEKEIRTLEVSRNVSQIAAIEEVRFKLVEMQKKMGKEKGVVMDGRYKELLDNGENVTYKDVLKNVEERDFLDSNREFSPLKKAENAIEFDNSDMGLDEQFERIYNYAMRVIEKQ